MKRAIISLLTIIFASSISVESLGFPEFMYPVTPVAVAFALYTYFNEVDKKRNEEDKESKIEKQ